jgi:hypothetical protein
MGRSRRRKCKHCRELFIPDHRNKAKQKYCSRPECRKASKVASQRKWQRKEENKTYFCGPENVRRVQEWRKNNPQYWKKRRITQEPLQDHFVGNSEEKQEHKRNLVNEPLQDLLTHYPTVLVGLLAHLTGSLLQDDIVHTGLRLQQLGRDILTEPSTNEGGHYDSKQATDTPAHGPPGSGAIQLDRSPSGP